VIVKLLQKNDSFDCYLLYQLYKLSPAHIVRCVSDLEQLGLATWQGTSICRLPDFQKQVFHLRHKIFARRLTWKEPPNWAKKKAT